MMPMQVLCLSQIRTPVCGWRLLRLTSVLGVSALALSSALLPVSLAGSLSGPLAGPLAGSVAAATPSQRSRELRPVDIVAACVEAFFRG